MREGTFFVVARARGMGEEADVEENEFLQIVGGESLCQSKERRNQREKGE
jgi:hypothetical protein